MSEGTYLANYIKVIVSLVVSFKMTEHRNRKQDARYKQLLVSD